MGKKSKPNLATAGFCFKFTVFRIEPCESQLVDYSYAAVIHFIMSCVSPYFSLLSKT